jgi:hypothetical protein
MCPHAQSRTLACGAEYAESLSSIFGDAHGRYAAYSDAKQLRNGHFWQNRFFSCALQ